MPRLLIVFLIAAQLLLGWGVHLSGLCRCEAFCASVQGDGWTLPSQTDSDGEPACSGESSCCEQREPSAPTEGVADESLALELACCDSCPVCSPEPISTDPAPTPQRSDSREAPSSCFSAAPIIAIVVFPPPTQIAQPPFDTALPIPPTRHGDRLARRCVWII